MFPRRLPLITALTSPPFPLGCASMWNGRRDERRGSDREGGCGHVRREVGSRGKGRLEVGKEVVVSKRRCVISGNCQFWNYR